MEHRHTRRVCLATVIGLGLLGLALVLDAEPLLNGIRAGSLLDREDLKSLWATISTLDPVYTLAVISAVLFFSGAGVPIPEDLPLTFTGILLSLPQTVDRFGGPAPSIITIGLITYAAILSGDLIAYTLGRRFGNDIATWPLLRLALSTKRRARLERWFARYGNWAVFLGRMVAGVRFVTFVSAGIAKMPVHRFVLFDSLASLVTVPAWIFLGYMIGTHFDQLLVWMSRVNATTWLVLGIGVVAFFVVRGIMRRRRKSRNVAAEVQSD